MTCQGMGAATRCWVRELELAELDRNHSVSAMEWIHKDSGCGPVSGRKTKALRKCYRDQFKELLGCMGLGPVPHLSLKKSLPSSSWCLLLAPQVTWGSSLELFRGT